MEYAESQLQWYKPIVEDENGNMETDETGDYKRRIPNEDDYEYANYQSWLRIIGEIENLI